MFKDGRTDGRTPDRPVYYKLTLSGELKTKSHAIHLFVMIKKNTKQKLLRLLKCQCIILKLVNNDTTGTKMMQISLGVLPFK